MTGIMTKIGRAFGAVRNTGNQAARRGFAAAVIAGLAGMTLAAAPASYAGEAGRYYGPERRDGDGAGRDWRHDGHKDGDDFALGLNIRIGEPYPAPRRERVWVEPVYRTVCEKIWVEPVYRDECERVWVAPVYRTVCDRVWVPARVEVRYVDRVGRHGRVYRDRVEQVVAPGHFDEVRRQELVTSGRWEEHPRRVLVTAGYFRTVERQELVSAGHWEWRPAGADRRDYGRSEFGLYARSRN
jgi:hypothetical protein